MTSRRGKKARRLQAEERGKKSTSDSGLKISPKSTVGIPESSEMSEENSEPLSHKSGLVVNASETYNLSDETPSADSEMFESMMEFVNKSEN